MGKFVIVRTFFIIFLLSFLSHNSWSFEGFGQNVTGGTGYSVVMVTNLTNSGAGSLRDALAGKSNRIIKFSVSGTISLASPITANGANITVDGTSAPSPGITITSSGDAILVHGNSGSKNNTTGYNQIYQGLRFRNTGLDSIQIAYNAHQIVVDHCSFNGAGDGAVDTTYGASEVTLSYNIFSNGGGAGASLQKYNAGHISTHHNLFYGNSDRNPIVWAMAGSPNHEDPVGDVRYNVIQQFSIGNMILSDATGAGAIGTANIVSNYYRPDNSGHARNNIIRSCEGNTARANAYIAGNLSQWNPAGSSYMLNCSQTQTVTTTNSMNNMASAYSAPAITGPTFSDKAGLINTWTSVINTAGVIPYFADDSTDAATRAAATVPSISLFDSAWNSDAAIGSGKVPTYPQNLIIL